MDKPTLGPSFDDDPFVVAVRDYILSTLRPLIPTGEKTGVFMFSLLRRALKSATREDLEQVVLHCVAFTDGLRAAGFISDELAREAHDYISTDWQPPITSSQEGAPDWAEVSGPGTADWADEIGEVDPSEILDTGLLTEPEPTDQGLGEATGTDTGHQTSVEGDSDDLGSVSEPAVQTDGAG